MIIYLNGDLLDSGAEALVNAVNCAGAMGAGIALQFKTWYPAMFDSYAAACRKGEVRIGEMFTAKVPGPGGTRYVINFPTKDHWRDPSQLSYIDAGIPALVQTLRDLDIGSVAVPPLGCGHGGLSWADVEPRLVAAFNQLPDVHVTLYPPQ